MLCIVPSNTLNNIKVKVHPTKYPVSNNIFVDSLDIFKQQE